MKTKIRVKAEGLNGADGPIPVGSTFTIGGAVPAGWVHFVEVLEEVDEDAEIIVAQGGTESEPVNPTSDNEPAAGDADTTADDEAEETEAEEAEEDTEADDEAAEEEETEAEEAEEEEGEEEEAPAQTNKRRRRR